MSTIGPRSKTSGARSPTAAAPVDEPAAKTPTSKPEATPQEPPQTDWVKRATSPAVQSASRGRAAANVSNPSASALKASNETVERNIIGGKDKPGVLVDLGGDIKKGATLTVHGINDNPGSAMPLGEKAKAQGSNHKTFAYDDNYRRLDKSAADFAQQTSDVLKDLPKGAKLTVNAHSMGTRVALMGLDQLAKEGKLDGRKVELNMVSPPLQGFDSANYAKLAPGFLGKAIKNVEPGKDMGSSSPFQKDLEAVRLPANVKVRVLYSSRDEVVDTKDPKFSQLAKQLGAQVVPLNVDPSLDGHTGAVVAAAQWLKAR